MIQNTSDQELMVQFTRNSDHGAFTELLRRWDYRVLAYLTRSCGNPEDALDLRQEVFLRVFRYNATYNADYPFSTWLFRIASNVLKTWQVKQNRLNVREQPLLENMQAHNAVDRSANPRDCAETVVLKERLGMIMSGLSLDERRLILLRLDLDLPYREIAVIFQEPETTIKSRFYTLLARIRRSLNHSSIEKGT